MAIIPTTQITISRFAASLYGAKLGNATNAEVLADVKELGLNNVLNSYYLPFAAMTSAQVAAIIVANVGVKEGAYGLSAQNVADAITVVTAELNNAAPFGTQGQAIAALMNNWANIFVNDPVFGEAAKAWNLKISQATEYARTAGSQDDAFGVINTTFELTSGNDTINGTDGADTFVAKLNTLSNGDVIDGKGGSDTLKAMVTEDLNGGAAVAPTIKNVEHLQFEAQQRASENFDNNLNGSSVVKVDFNTNVTSITGFDVLENNNSRADLILEDVRIANSQITKDITVVMRETDPGDVDFGVYFDQNSLRNASSSNSQITLKVLDTYAAALGKDPLLDSPYGSFTFFYSVAGGEQQKAVLASDAIQNAQTFPEMIAALQAAADSVFGAGTVTVEAGATYSVPDSVTGKLVSGTSIVLKTKGDIQFDTTAKGSGWLATETVPATSGLYTDYTTKADTSIAPVTVKVVLDDVGRGSTGGDLVIGGMSTGVTSSSKGVERFEIEVQDNSKLQTISSTNNTLKEVVITNGVTTRVDNAWNENQKDAGSLSVLGDAQGAYYGGTGGDRSLTNQALPGITGHGVGFTDVRVIDGSAMTGKLEFSAEITEASIAKYLNLKDGAPAGPADDNVAFQYTGGANNDKMYVSIDGDVLASSGLASREDFKFTADGGAGDDVIVVATDYNTAGASANWLADQQLLKNLNILGGAGNDTITTLGNGNFNIDAGTGNDTVYVDNGNVTGVNNGFAAWVINTAGDTLVDTKLTDLNSGAISTSFLYKGEVTVSFEGFEAKASIPANSVTSAVSQLSVNQAIKAAINGDAVLSKLLVAEDGPAGVLVVKALSNGLHVNTDFVATVSAAAAPGAGTAEETAMVTAYQAFVKAHGTVPGALATAADATTATAGSVTALNGVTGMTTGGGVFGSVLADNDAAGINSSNHSDNIIELGAGNDVVTLGTGANDNDTLVFKGYGLGKDSVLNFTAGAAAAGTDKLDFTSYLTNAGANGVRYATTLNADTTIDANANNVTVLTSAVFNTTDAKFSDLTAANFLASVNNDGVTTNDFAGLLDGSLTGLASEAGKKTVVLVANNLNAGEYAAFELTMGNGATAGSEFTDAKLIGVIDFGAATVLHQDNLA